MYATIVNKINDINTPDIEFAFINPINIIISKNIIPKKILISSII